MTSKKKAVTQEAPKADVAVIEIEDGVPIPQVQTGRGKWPFEAMKPGQSFLVKCAEKDAKKVRANLNASARRVSAQHEGRTFLCLWQAQEGGVRCWRSDAGPEILPDFDSAESIE